VALVHDLNCLQMSGSDGFRAVDRTPSARAVIERLRCLVRTTSGLREMNGAAHGTAPPTNELVTLLRFGRQDHPVHHVDHAV
jgi:hypothetical protein